MVTAGCRCRTCIERAGYVELAEVWQARAAQAEERVAKLRVAVALLRRVLDPLTSAGYRLPDDRPDDEPGFVRVTNQQVRDAYRAYLFTGGGHG